MLTMEQLIKELLPPHGTINVVKLYKGQSLGGMHSGSQFFCIPDPSDSAAKSFLGSLKATGYDWRPAPLTPMQIRYDWHVYVYLGNSYHRYQEVEEQLLQRFHIREMELSDEDLQRFLFEPKEKKEEVKLDPKEVKESDSNLYGRCRALWKNHHTKFGNWETKFVKNIGSLLANDPQGKRLTPNQRKELLKMFDKYKVGESETASTDFN